jgi:acyl-CoA synthetase (AMP-forming)/AMP-acid ligase II
MKRTTLIATCLALSASIATAQTNIPLVFDKENTAEDGVEQALKKVKEELSLSVSRFAMPRSFELVESIPKTKVGKIDIAALTNNN